ncbi:MAG: glutamate racemase [Treponema sp.]|nr:glutamate racemase [Treponema sp.]
MNNRPILFIDSGIGGLPYCRDFMQKNPQEEVCYLADRQNFPYGPRDKDELVSIILSLTEKMIKTTDPKIIVLACNTAAVSALTPLRERFPGIPFVGTVPAIKPAASATKTGKIGVLGSARTIEDPYSQNLAEDCENSDGAQNELIGVAAPDMVEFVEKHYDTAEKKEKSNIVKKYIDIFRSKNADTIVLACTHFLYLTDEFKEESAPDIKVLDSLEGVTKRIEFLLDENDGELRAEIDFEPVPWLFLTGEEPADLSWHNRSSEMGFALCLLDTI